MAQQKEDTYISGEEHQALHRVKSEPNKQVTIQTRWLGWVIAAIVLCGVSFWGGMTYQKHHTKALAATASSQAGSNGFSGRAGFGGGSQRGGSFGQVTAVSSTSITVSNQRTGASTTFAITGSTSITDNGQTVTTSDIQTGDTVIIMTASGSSTASRILVNPSFGGGFGGGSSPDSSGGSATTQSN